MVGSGKNYKKINYKAC